MQLLSDDLMSEKSLEVPAKKTYFGLFFCPRLFNFRYLKKISQILFENFIFGAYVCSDFSDSKSSHWIPIADLEIKC